MGGKQLPFETKKLVLNLWKYQRSRDEVISDLDLDRKVADMIGLPERTVRTVRMLDKRGVLDSPPTKKPSPVMDKIDGFDEACIRREILAFYERGELPTLDTVLNKVKESIDFPGGRSSLHKIIKKIGFKFNKVQSGRYCLMEREDIVVHRCKYLRKLQENRNSDNPRTEIYLDETWVNQNECVSKCWTTSDGSAGPKLKTGKGARFIILHAGGEHGFVPGGLLMFRSRNGNKGDYHDSMNNQCFMTWFTDQLLPNIPEHSIIIMDNASYHSKVLNKAPTKNTRKAEILSWLSENNIPHDASHNKLELMQLVDKNKGEKRYEIDEVARTHGHEILRLPPYHCTFNPIELIWAQVKHQIRQNNSNSNQTILRVEEITKEAINRVTPDNWKQCMKHTRAVEDKYRANDVISEHLIEEFRITLTDSDFSSDDEN